jgi:hypothetical protein
MSGRLMIKCRQAHQLLSERMDRPISATERLRLWVHLRVCDMCSRVERQLGLMQTAIRRLGE